MARHLMSLLVIPLLGLGLSNLGYYSSWAVEPSPLLKQKKVDSLDEFEEIPDTELKDEEYRQKLLKQKHARELIRQRQRQASLEVKKEKEEIEDKTLERKYFLGMGAVGTFLGKTSHEKNGATKVMWPQTMISVNVGARLPVFFPELHICPALMFTPLGAADADEGVTSRIITLSGIFSYETFHFRTGGFEFKMGPGLMINSIVGQGGSINLNNGNTTSTFYHPALSATASAYYFDLGLGLFFSRTKKYRVDLDAFVAGLAGSRRTFNVQALLQYGFF